MQLNTYTPVEENRKANAHPQQLQSHKTPTQALYTVVVSKFSIVSLQLSLLAALLPHRLTIQSTPACP